MMSVYEDWPPEFIYHFEIFVCIILFEIIGIYRLRVNGGSRTDSLKVGLEVNFGLLYGNWMMLFNVNWCPEFKKHIKKFVSIIVFEINGKNRSRVNGGSSSDSLKVGNEVNYGSLFGK